MGHLCLLISFIKGLLDSPPLYQICLGIPVVARKYSFNESHGRYDTR